MAALQKKKDRHLLIMLSYYDHAKNEVPKPVIVFDKKGVDDPHDNASLSIDELGYIWVYVSGRNTSRPGLIFKSKRPYSIDDFEQIREAEITYPQPWWVAGKGFIHLFTKYTKGRELYWSTSADGRTWTPDQKLAGMGGHYQVSNMHNGTLYTVFNYHPGGNVDKRTNCYLLKSADMGNTWTTIDGKPVQTPLTNKQHPAMVKDYEAEGKMVYLNDLNFDAEGNPVILAIISRHHAPGPQGDPREWVTMHWKNGQWHFNTVTTSRIIMIWVPCISIRTGGRSLVPRQPARSIGVPAAKWLYGKVPTMAKPGEDRKCLRIIVNEIIPMPGGH